MNNTILAEIRKAKETRSETLAVRSTATDFPALTPQADGQEAPTPQNKKQNRRGWEPDWIPLADEELNLLVDREDPVRKLINHNLQG